MDPAVKWLLLEGLLPLLGAGLTYTLLGCGRYLSTANKSTFSFEWKHALDPLGWLYGAIIISLQSGLKSYSLGATGILPFACFLATFICLILMIAAMVEYGSAQTWHPPRSLKVGAGVLVIAILCAGFKVQTLIAAAIKIAVKP